MDFLISPEWARYSVLTIIIKLFFVLKYAWDEVRLGLFTVFSLASTEKLNNKKLFEQRSITTHNLKTRFLSF